MRHVLTFTLLVIPGLFSAEKREADLRLDLLNALCSSRRAGGLLRVSHFPCRWQILRLWAKRLRDDEATGLRGVEDAAVANDGTETLA